MCYEQLEDPKFLKSILNLDIGEEFDNIKDEDIAQVQKGTMIVEFPLLTNFNRVGFISKNKGTNDGSREVISNGKYLLC